MACFYFFIIVSLPTTLLSLSLCLSLYLPVSLYLSILLSLSDQYWQILYTQSQGRTGVSRISMQLRKNQHVCPTLPDTKRNTSDIIHMLIDIIATHGSKINPNVINPIFKHFYLSDADKNNRLQYLIGSLRSRH